MDMNNDSDLVILFGAQHVRVPHHGNVGGRYKGLALLIPHERHPAGLVAADSLGHCFCSQRGGPEFRIDEHQHLRARQGMGAAPLIRAVWHQTSGWDSTNHPSIMRYSILDANRKTGLDH